MFYKDLSTERKFRVLDVNFLKKDSLKYLFLGWTIVIHFYQVVLKTP